MLKSFMQPGTSSNSKTHSPTTGQPAHESSRSSRSSQGGEPGRAEASSPGSRYVRNEEGSKLIVGPNIKLKGSEITDCEILVVEGRVEAAMKSRDILIAEGGVFSGKAEIDVAEVRGTFEGELTARLRLIIHASGKVSGTIRYGALTVEEGGVLCGDVAGIPPGPATQAATTTQPATTPEGRAGQQESSQAASLPFRGQGIKRLG